MRRIFILLFLLVFMAACGSTPPENTVVATPTSSLPVNGNGVSLVARVNGVEITLPQFERSLLRSERGSMIADPNALRHVVLDTMIEQVLIVQAAGEMGIFVTDEELNTELQTYINEAGGAQGWESWLETNLYTEEEFRESLRSTMVTSRVLEFVTQEVTGTVTQVHARHILVRTEQEANDILTRINNGEDFAALATVSLDVTTRDTGGDLGWFTREQLLEPTLADVAFSLQPGEMAGPIPTRLGYHIIQTLEIEERAVGSENQAALAQTRFELWLQSLLDTAIIERFL